MKKITNTLIILLIALNIFGQGHVTFDDMTTGSGSYNKVTFTTDGIEWVCEDGRTDQTLNGPAICFGKRSNTLTSGSISGGLSSFSFDFKQGFSSPGTLTVKINDQQIGETVTVTSTKQTFLAEDLSIEGDFVVTIEATGRSLIDDIKWTEYDASAISSKNDIKTFSINSVDGVVDTENHTVTLTLPAGTDVTALTPQITFSPKAGISPAIGERDFSSPVEYTITAEDNTTQIWTVTVNVELPAVTLSASENSGTETDQTEITITATTDVNVSSDQTVTVQIQGDNILNEDYNISSTDITIASGTNSGSVTFKVLDDDTEEGNEQANISIASVSAGLQFDQENSIDINITDNDKTSYYEYSKDDLATWSKYGYIGVSDSNLRFGSGSQTGSITSPDLALTGDFKVVINAKEYDSDEKVMYVSYNSITIEISLNGQANYEAEFVAAAENKPVKIFSKTKGKRFYVYSASIEKAIPTPPTASIIASATSLSENSGENTSSITLKLNKPFTTDVTANLTVTGVDASDFTFVNTITIPAGQQSKSATFTVEDDEVEEASETAIITLSGITSGINISEESKVLNLTIADNDAKSTENNILTFKIGNRTGVVNTNNHTVVIDVAHGTDVTTLSPEITISDKATITPANGESQNFTTPVEYTVTAEDNSQQKWTVTVNVEAPALPKISLSLSTNSASEASQTAITVTATSNETLTSNESVSLSVSGNGISSNDYTLSNTTITIPSGQSSADVTITITDDEVVEGTETMVLTLTSPSSGIELSSTYTSTVTISDNDSNAGNGDYLTPEVDAQGKIIVRMTPKEYVQTVSTGQHMMSVGIKEGYYSSAIGLSGSALRAELKTITSTKAKQLSYDDVWDMCEDGDENPKNSSQVWQMYVEKGIAKSAHVSGSTGWNREHTWAKSHGNFGTSRGRGTDGHHLRATDAKENSRRGNKDFAESGGYLPPKSARGDVARIIFFMGTRWGMTVDNKTSGTSARHGKLNDLLKWHNEDPVDPYEIRRNNVIFGYQNNRNPFIDHPELVELVFGNRQSEAWTGGNTAGGPVLTLNGSVSEFPVTKFGNSSEVKSYTISGSNLEENITVTAPSHFEIATSNSDASFTKTLTLTQNSGDVASTTIYVRFKPESALGSKASGNISHSSGDKTKTIAVSGTEGDPLLVPTVFLSEDFETNCASNWIKYSVASNKNWGCADIDGNETNSMHINNYQGDVASEDWLITPVISFNNYSNTKLGYKIYGKYSGSTLKLMFSSDYSGSGDPSTAIWSEVSTISIPSEKWEDQEVALTSVAEEGYIAFKHTTANASNSNRIGIDDIKFSGVEANIDGSITVSETSFEFEYIDVDAGGSASKAKTYTLSGDNISNNVTLQTAYPFQISLDGNSWNETLTTAVSDSDNITVSVRFNPTSSYFNDVNGTITHTAENARKKTINLKAKGNDIVVPLPSEYVKTVTAGEHYTSVGIPVNYYTSAKNKKGSELKTSIKAVIDAGFVSYPYEESGRGNVDISSRRMVTGEIPKDIYDIIDMADQHPTKPNDVYLVYTEDSYPKSHKHLGMTGSEEKWNREHMYPQSMGGFKDGRAPWGKGTYSNGNIIENAGDAIDFAHSDGHHLRASDKAENNRRGSLSYSSYSPPNSSKGDAARIVFYLNLRYGLDINKVGSVALFLQWHRMDPVDPYEVRRNNVIFRYQKNRNPFIDHPELANYIYGDKVNEVWNAVPKQNQTITFAQLSDKTYGNEKFELNATASSGLDVTYTSSNNSVATVTGNIITITGAGTTDITAKQNGNAEFNAAPVVVQSLTVNKAEQNITFNAFASKNMSDSDFAPVASASSGLNLEFNSSNSSVAIIKNGKISLTGIGETEITASQEGNDNFNAAVSVTKTLTVEKGDQTITFSPIQSKTILSSEFELNASVNSGLEITYVSSNSDVAVIIGKKVSIKGVGETIITASQTGNDLYNAATNVSQTFTVVKEPQTITFNSLENKKATAPDFDLTATSTSGLEVTYSSSNTSVATISGNKVSIHGVGTTTITASQIGDNTYAEATQVEQTLVVGKSSQHITFNSIDDKNILSADFDLNANSDSGLEVTYTSSDENVATISGNTVSVKGIGETTITASQAGNDDFSAAESVEQTLKVTKVSQEITLTDFPSTTIGDAPFELSATATSGLEVTFTSSDPTVASISGTTVTLHKIGTTYITVSQSGNATYDAAEDVIKPLYVKDVVLKDQSITFTKPDNKTYGDSKFSLNASATSGLDIVFTSNNSDVAAVNGNEVTITGAGKTIITATQEGNHEYNAATDISYELEVSKAEIIVEAEDKIKYYGDENPELTYTLVGVVNNDDISISMVTSADKSSDVGDYNIVATLDGDKINNYNISKYDGTLIVESVSLKIIGNNASRVYGRENPEFTGSVTGIKNNDDISVTYTTTATKSSDVDLYDIKVDVSGEKLKNYTLTKTSGILEVIEANLTITPEDKYITYGQEIPELTGTVSGVKNGDIFDISYSSNAIDKAGSYEISVNITGDKLSNYNVVKNKADLIISKANLIAKAFDKTKTYGELNPQFDGDLKGIVNNDDITVIYSCGASSKSDIGDYPITVSVSGNKSSNYFITRTNGTLSITKADLLVKVNNMLREYSLDNPTFDASVTGVKNGDDFEITYSCVADKDSETGEYPITATVEGSKSNNYTIKVTPGSLEVTKKRQVVTVEEIPELTYGDENLNLSIKGKNSSTVVESSNTDVISVENGSLKIIGAGTTTLTIYNPGDKNYFESEKVIREVTVQKADQTINFAQIPTVHVDDVVTLEAESDIDLDVEFTITEGEATISGNQLTLTKVGTLTIKAFNNGNNNYNGAFTTQTINVEKATSVEFNIDEVVKIYPNPANDVIYFNVKDITNTKILFYTSTGKLVRSDVLKSENSLNISDMKSGVYYLLIKTKNKTLNQKIVIR